VYSFSIWDRDFGPGFIKLRTYFFPYPSKVWPNGHQWTKRQADQAGIAYRAMSNGFAACEDPDRPQAVCGRFGLSRVSLTVSDRC
jgi:hypothetical protein